MNHGIYIAAAGMKSRMEALTVASNNVANAGTVGFKKDRVFFGIFNRVNGSNLEKALADSAVAEATRTNFGIGPLMRTSNPLNLALAEDGFFTVQTPQGVRYTRAGEFSLNSRRQMVTPQGLPVLGENGRPIVLPPGQVEIGPQGDVQADGVVAGRLKIVHFEDLSLLRKNGNVLFEALPGAVETRPQRLTVKQGFLERSNVNPVAGMADALANMRSFEFLARALHSISNEVDKKAIDEVGRV